LNKLSVPGPDNEERANIWLNVEVPSEGRTRVVISTIQDSHKLDKEFSGRPIVEINHRSIRSWLDENFTYCKRMLRSQCDRDLESNLLGGVLSWKQGPLVYTVLKRSKRHDLLVSFGTGGIEKQIANNSSDPYAKRKCDWKWQKRYPSFKPIHLGYFACLFEKSDDPTTLLLRIASFQYKKGRGHLDPNQPIQSLRNEVNALEKVWTPISGSTKHLIIDLIDNHGGNEPIPYYKILFRKPFLEQFVRFKKTPEFENENLRNSAFWDESAHRLWFEKIVSNGQWAKLKEGEFTEPTAQFCADSAKPCDEAFFQPLEHAFSGKISVMVNDNCVSSCDGFAWQLQHHLKAKLYGFYPASDTAYSRWRLDVIRDPAQLEGFRIEVNEQDADWDKNLILAQDVAISLSTDENGVTLSGEPLSLDRFVPIRSDDYHQRVLKEVLKH